jgi:hypothetical protein
MIYLSINRKDVKLISLTKTLLGQFHVSYFSKHYEADFITDDKLVNMDVIASAVKEALTSSHPKPVQDKQVCLILPQTAFVFTRYEVPPDISPTALLAFARDKARSEMSIQIDDYIFDYFLSTQENHQYVLLFGIHIKLKEMLVQTLKLVDLSISTIVPDSASYYSLFDKTVKSDKKEYVLFVHYGKEESYGYLYDNAGLLNNKQYYFTGSLDEPLKNTVEEIEKENIKVNRLILSGEPSDTIRQDLFTKQVGAWTNPLKKILTQFYQENLKVFIVGTESKLPILEYDVCFGAHLFTQKNTRFNLAKNATENRKRLAIAPLSNPLKKLSKRDLIIFALSFIVTFIAIFGFTRTINIKLSLLSFSKPSPTPSPSPTIAPSPTPSIKKEDINIKVLNGSGTAGKAGEFKTVLEEKGYKEIITGNADNYDYTKTEIQYKKEIESIVGTLKVDLKNIVPKATYELLESSSAADLIITFGTDFE